MISTRTFKYLVFTTNFSYFFGGVQYRFVKDKKGVQTIEPNFTRRRTLFTKTNFMVNVFYICFIAWRFLQKAILGKEPVSVEFIVQMGYLFLCYTMTVVLQFNLMLFWTETPHYLMQYMSFFKNLKEKYIIPEKDQGGIKCAKFFSSIFVIGNMVNLQNIIIIMKRPHELHYLTSLIPNVSRQTSIIVRLPFILVNMWIWMTTWSYVWVSCFHLYAYISCLVWTLREMDNKAEAYKTRNALREGRNFAIKLRALHVLHRFWPYVHQGWFCPSHKFVAISVGTLSSYGVIKLSGPRSIVMGCMAMISVLYLWNLFRKFGKLYDTSETMLENWRNGQKSSRWMRMYIRSIPIFRIDIGSFYFVEKTTAVAIIDTIINNTITLLFL